MLNLLTNNTTFPKLKKQICIDLGTGTGFLARHFADEFEQVIGTDSSDKQLEQARIKSVDKKNLTYRQANLSNLNSFLEENSLEGKIDLFTLG